MNLIHSNLNITDGWYGMFTTADIGKRISSLGENLASGNRSQGEIISQIIALAEMLKNSSVSAGPE